MMTISFFQRKDLRKINTHFEYTYSVQTSHTSDCSACARLLSPEICRNLTFPITLIFFFLFNKQNNQPVLSRSNKTGCLYIKHNTVCLTKGKYKGEMDVIV